MDRVCTFVVILSTTQRTVTQRAVQAMGTQFEKVSASAARCGLCRENLQLKHQGWGNLSEAVGSRQSPDVEPEQREASSRKREPRVQAWAVRGFRVL